MGTRYLSTEKAAEYLGFGTGKNAATAIRLMVHRRQIPFNKMGTRLRFDRVELDAWMKDNSVKAE